MYFSTAIVLAVTYLAPAAFAVPTPATEVCQCEPLQESKWNSPTYSDSLAACNRVAHSLEHWRGSTFHSPNFGEQGIEYQALQMSQSFGLEPSAVKERSRLELLGCRSKAKNLWNKVRRAASTPVPQKREAATYRQSADKFRILCQPAPQPSVTAVSLQWAAITFLMMAIMWLCIFELAIDLYIRVSNHFNSDAAEGTIVLIGDEQTLLADEKTILADAE